MNELSPKKDISSSSFWDKKGLLLLLFSVILCLLAAEWFVHKFIPRQAYYPSTARVPLAVRVPHPKFGWTLEKGAEYQISLREKTISVKYNDQGQRDVVHAVAKPPGVFRVVVLGDSYMEAYSVSLEDSFSRQLERKMRALGYNAEVINLGVGGYGTFQEYITYLIVAKKYSPDLVLLGFDLENDLVDNSLELSLATRGRTNMKLISRPFLIKDKNEIWRIITIDYESTKNRYLKAKAELEQRAKSRSDSLLYRIVDSSALLSLLYNLVKDDSPATGSLAGLGEGWISSMAKLPDKQWNAKYGAYACSITPSYHQAWEITERILVSLKERVELSGSKLGIFTIPSQLEIDKSFRKKVMADVPRLGKLCLDDPPAYGHFKTILANAGISLIDLRPDFIQMQLNNSEGVIRKSDMHWNENGHELAAKNVLNWLVRSNLLPDQPQYIGHP